MTKDMLQSQRLASPNPGAEQSACVQNCLSNCRKEFSFEKAKEREKDETFLAGDDEKHRALDNSYISPRADPLVLTECLAKGDLQQINQNYSVYLH